MMTHDTVKDTAEKLLRRNNPKSAFLARQLMFSVLPPSHFVENYLYDNEGRLQDLDNFPMLKQIYDQNGKPIEGLFEDTNRDGLINNDDRQISQKPAADVLLGFSTSLSIKKFSFGIAGHGMLGNYLYNNVNSNNATMRSIKNPVQFIGNATRDLLTTNFNNNWYLSDYYLDNASFFRIDNINFGYEAGRVFNDKATLRVNASIQNVFVITKYGGLDPENAGDGGVDGNLYPRPRVYSIGFNLDF